MSRNKYDKNNPLVSIIVPTYNRRDWLPITIESLLGQTYKNIEILVINDAGDSVKDIVDSYKDKRIRYFEHPQNAGLGAARNTGLQNFSGDYVIFLDDDDILLPIAIEFRLWQMKKLGAEVVYTRALQNIFEPVDSNGKKGYQLAHRQLYWDSPFDRDLLLIQNVCPCNCVMFSRNAWDNCGNYWFDEKLTTSEDVDFWVHLSRPEENTFYELKLIDCEDSFRTDKSQMTGSRTGFVDHMPMLYKRWREFAKNKEWVVENQNRVLRARGLNPKDYDL